MSTAAPLAVCARELSPADRIKVGSTVFVVVDLPAFVDEDHVRIKLTHPTTRQVAGIGAHWRQRFEVVPPHPMGEAFDDPTDP